MWWWTHDAGVLYKVPVTFPLTSSHMPTASLCIWEAVGGKP